MLCRLCAAAAPAPAPASYSNAAELAVSSIAGSFLSHRLGEKSVSYKRPLFAVEGNAFLTDQPRFHREISVREHVLPAGQWVPACPRGTGAWCDLRAGDKPSVSWVSGLEAEGGMPQSPRRGALAAIVFLHTGQAWKRSRRRPVTRIRTWLWFLTSLAQR